MSDCSNVDVREMLPDLMHDALDDETRLRVEHHLTTCDDCVSELVLLQTAQRAMAAVKVAGPDVPAIVRALPKPMGAQHTIGRSRSLALRLAAAVTFVSLGSMSIAVARSYFGTHDVIAVDSLRSRRSDSVAALPGRSDTVAPSASTPGARTVSAPVGISDLNDADLATLLGELDALEAAPSAEPDGTPGGKVTIGSVTGT